MHNLAQNHALKICINFKNLIQNSCLIIAMILVLVTYVVLVLPIVWSLSIWFKIQARVMNIQSKDLQNLALVTNKFRQYMKYVSTLKGIVKSMLYRIHFSFAQLCSTKQTISLVGIIIWLVIPYTAIYNNVSRTS